MVPGPIRPGPGYLPTGATRPRTPGYFLLVQKVPKNTPRPRSWNPLSNRILADLDSALPLNKRILWTSNLCRVSHPTLAVALLKRRIHLFVSLDTKCLSSRGLTSEIGCPPDRLRGRRRQKEKFSGCAVFPCWRPIGQKTGAGVSPAAFWSLFRRGKSDPGVGAGEAP